MADRKISALTELTAPATADTFPIVDVSEAANVDKNKKIEFGTLHKALPDGTEAGPAVAFLSDSSATGLYRSGANELAFSANSTNIGKITATGFQLGTGTAAAQLHLFSTDTTDQVIIENTDAGLDTAPDVVLYRNSASPAADDNLGNLEFRGEDDAGNAQAYAQILAQIQDPTSGSEDGTLDLMTASGGSVATRIRLFGNKVGIGEAAPAHPLHITESVENTALFLESKENVAVSAGDITLYHHRNGAVGQAADALSALIFQGNNGAGTPEQIQFAKIEASIVDPVDTTEDGKIDLQVQAAGTLTSMAAITAANVTLGSRPILPTHTPASATAAGTLGEVAWDANYIYVCTATNTWKRVAIGTWS